jgi:hypothetical protein|tara:strand:+ start:5767 stop:5883 length:117 start_codon:yes stop_codon:yes gene_type:complete
MWLLVACLVSLAWRAVGPQVVFVQAKITAERSGRTLVA